MSKAGKVLAKFAAAVARAAAKTGKMFGKGAKVTYDFGAGMVQGAFGMVFGRGGGAPAKSAASEELDEVLENIANPDLDMEDVFTPEEIAQKAEQDAVLRALTMQMEPKDVNDYAKADSKAKREEIGGVMREKTRNWVMSLSNDQLDGLAKAGEYGIRNHVSNIRHIPNVPKYSFGADYSGMELSHKEPAPKDFGQAKSNYFGKRNELVSKAAPAKEAKFAEGFHKQLDLMADQDYEADRPASAPAPRPSFAKMR